METQPRDGWKICLGLRTRRQSKKKGTRVGNSEKRKGIKVGRGGGQRGGNVRRSSSLGLSFRARRHKKLNAC